MMDDLNEHLLEILECPICFEVIEPPIYQCKNQHLLCSKCLCLISECPVCNTQLVHSDVNRNIIMEQIAAYVRYPCKFDFHGCRKKLLLKERTTHYHECPYADEHHCNFTNDVGEQVLCDFVGNHVELMEHISSAHSHDILVSSRGTFSVDVTECKVLMKYDGTLFQITVFNKPSGSPGTKSVYFHILQMTNVAPEKSYCYEVVALVGDERDENFKGFVGDVKDDICESASRNECLYFLCYTDEDTVFDGFILKAK